MNKRLVFWSILIIVVLCMVGYLKKTFCFHSVYVSAKTQKCIECHAKNHLQESQIEEWKHSKHAKAGVGCYECHRAKKDYPGAWNDNGFIITTIVSPKICGKCHEREFKEFEASHHAQAGEILGSADNYLGEAVEGPGASVQGCQSCHGSVVKVDSAGKLDYTTWPNLGIGRLNPDGSKGSCASCHSRHRFSLEVARSPEACAKCHLGPDHPQKEIYDESKHGINFAAHKDKMNLGASPWILGKDYTQAPNCVTCHMGGNNYLTRSHEIGGRLSWTLRPAVSVRQENWEQKRSDMKKVCQNCHAPEWRDNFFKQFDQTVTMYNENFAKPAAEIMGRLNARKAITDRQFDEDIKWVYFELWHHEGRRARHGAAMMGPDFVQWHGFYEIAKTFYFEFLPKAEKLGEGEYVKNLLNRPEHSWIKGVKPDGMKFQEEAFKKWKEMSDAAQKPK